LTQHGHLQSDNFFGEDTDEKSQERQDGDGHGQFVDETGL